MGLLLTIATPVGLALFAILMERCEGASTTSRARKAARRGAPDGNTSNSSPSGATQNATHQSADGQSTRSETAAADPS